MAEEKDPLREAMSQYFAKLGSKGGKIGGKKRWEGISPEQRAEWAKKAVAAREAKRKKKGKP